MIVLMFSSIAMKLRILKIAIHVLIQIVHLYVPHSCFQVTVPIVRNGGIFGTVQVSYTSIQYTAQEGVDYVTSAGDLTFAEGVDSVDVTIAILQDTIPEGPEEFWLNITSVQLLSPT